MKFDILIADTNEFVVSQFWDHVPVKGAVMHVHDGDDLKYYEVVSVVYDIDKNDMGPNSRYSKITVFVQTYQPLQSV